VSNESGSQGRAYERVASGEANVGLDDKLYKVKYKTDDVSHLKIKDQGTCLQCDHKPCIPRCPAEVYELEKDEILVAFENCLECGVCKIVCPYDNIEWEYPRGGFGVVWKFG
jgi:ferredoxin like protein